MASTKFPSNDSRRQVGSPKSSKASENRDTLCRNIRIYGHCRYQDTCIFNHDMEKNSEKNASLNEHTSKKTLSVESPIFDPSKHILQQSQQKTQQSAASKKSVLSAATAPVFTPKKDTSSNASAMQSKPQPPKFNVESREFKPTPNFEGTGNHMGQHSDPFAGPYPNNVNSIGPPLPQYTSSYNSFAPEQAGLGAGSVYYSQPLPQSFATQPLQYHLYQPGLMDSYRSDLQPWQRTTYDFFIPNNIRHELTEKSRATLQIMDGLPQLDNYHSLCGLDIGYRKNPTTFAGYQSWLYKAKSSKNGNYYALRRIQAYHLSASNENALLGVLKEWKKIKNGNIVTVHEAFTTRHFQDSSLMFAYDYHPMSKTLHQQHFQGQTATNTTRMARAANTVDEPTLWGYICQIANALREIHSRNLAARCIDLTKIIITSKNRIRLSACSVLDVLNFEEKPRVQELQQQDLLSFGKVILALATNSPNIQPGNAKAAMDTLGTRYTLDFKHVVGWLCTPSTAEDPKTITSLLSLISGQMAKQLDCSFSANDEQTSVLARELENGRIARLMMKLSAIIEREVLGPSVWSQTQEVYLLRLFRDYVFHQVDLQGRPSLDLGHMISCLNKLDVGTEELMCLTTHDNETAFVCSYKEVQQMLNRRFNELMRLSQDGRE